MNMNICCRFLHRAIIYYYMLYCLLMLPPCHYCRLLCCCHSALFFILLPRCFMPLAFRFFDYLPLFTLSLLLLRWYCHFHFHYFFAISPPCLIYFHAAADAAAGCCYFSPPLPGFIISSPLIFRCRRFHWLRHVFFFHAASVSLIRFLRRRRFSSSPFSFAAITLPPCQQWPFHYWW